MSDVLWQELREQAERFGPRHDTKYGICYGCALGFTTMLPWSGVTWGACGFCGLCRPVGTGLFDVPPLADPDAELELIAYVVSILAEYDVASIPPEGVSMKQTKTESAVPTLTGLDPRVVLARKGDGQGILAHTQPEERCAFFAEFLADLRAHPVERDVRGCLKVDAWSHRCWDRIRARPVSADGTTVDQWLNRDGLALYTLQSLAQRVEEARQRRAELVEQLTMLDFLEAVDAVRG